MMNKTLPTLEKATLIFNGNFGFVALFFVLFGGLCTSFLVKDFDIDSLIYLQVNTLEGKGEITGIYETNVSVNERSVLGYDYLFHSPDGDMQWTSFSTKRNNKVGDEVVIEYSSNRPDVNRIKGMDSNAGGGILTFAFLFIFLAGVVWVLINASNGLKKIKLIEQGEMTEANLVDKYPTATKINDRTVYKLTFEYKAKDGRVYKVSSKTHQPEKLEDDSSEMVIYDERNPENSLMVDILPWTLPKYLKENWG